MTKPDWLTRARDSGCAKPSKTRPPSYVPVNLDLHNITMNKELRQRTTKPQSANLSNDETLNANMLAGILEVARF